MVSSRISVWILALLLIGFVTFVGMLGFMLMCAFWAGTSGLILFGLSLGYGSRGTLTIGDFVAAAAAGVPQGLSACILVLSGFFLKGAVCLYHSWATAPMLVPGCRSPGCSAYWTQITPNLRIGGFLKKRYI